MANDLDSIRGGSCTKSSIDPLKLDEGRCELTLDKHPFNGRARITVGQWDDWGDGEVGHSSASYVLSLNECIRLRDQLTKRIEEDLLCVRENKTLRCEKQCASCARIQAGLPD
jgi:hypothetical protein